MKLDTFNQWKDKISTVCQGYEPKDIFNMDECGLFYRDSTKSTFFKKGDSCAGGKRSNQRIMIAVYAFMTGRYSFLTIIREYAFLCYKTSLYESLLGNCLINYYQQSISEVKF